MKREKIVLLQAQSQMRFERGVQWVLQQGRCYWKKKQVQNTTHVASLPRRVQKIKKQITMGLACYEGKARGKKHEIRWILLGLARGQSPSKQQRNLTEQNIIFTKGASGEKCSFEAQRSGKHREKKNKGVKSNWSWWSLRERSRDRKKDEHLQNIVGIEKYSFLGWSLEKGKRKTMLTFAVFIGLAMRAKPE